MMRQTRAGEVSWSEARAEGRLRSLELFGMRFGLDRMRRMMTALDSATDPEAILKTWFSWGNQGLDQFQRFMRENTPKKG